MFISRVQLLPEDETTAEHAEAKRIEAQLIETDRTMITNGEPGLFKGAFCKSRPQYNGPIRDQEDGVLRCPRCTWEMENGECGQCGYATDEEDFSDDDGDTIESRSVISIPSSTMDADVQSPRIPSMNAFLFPQSRTADEDFREWMRRDQEARRGRRAVREIQRRNRQARVSTADTEGTTSTMVENYHDEIAYGNGGADDEEIVGFLARHPITERRWNSDMAEDIDEDEDMTSDVDDEDGDSTTSFYRAAILAQNQGMNPPFESDLSTNVSETGAEDETATTNGSDSDEMTESDDNDTPGPTPTVQRLASRPARVVVDSDDESSSDSGSSEEDENNQHDNDDDDDEESSDDSSEDDPTSSTPRPAAARQARVQMHRSRRGIGGRGRGRGRPRRRN